MLLAALLLMIFTTFPALADEKKEFAFDRILKTNTIKCGYYVFPPVTYKDSETGEVTGMFVDMMNVIAERAGLDVEWTEEVTFGNWGPALQSGRYDAVCTPLWPDLAASRIAAFTKATFYAGIYPMVRANDERFEGVDLERLNNEDVTFLSQDGTNLTEITKAKFPRAKIRTMPAKMDGPTLLQEIVTGKADAILLDKNAEIHYNKNNPVKLKLLVKGNPLKVQPFTYAVRRQDLGLKDFLNEAIDNMHNDGTIARLINKWETEPGLFIPIAKPYEVSR